MKASRPTVIVAALVLLAGWAGCNVAAEHHDDGTPITTTLDDVKASPWASLLDATQVLKRGEHGWELPPPFCAI